MGFRTGAYAKVWGVEAVSSTLTKGRISISRKNKNTGEYVQDFSGFVTFVGTATASKALQLKERDTIRLGDVDSLAKYDKDKKTTYYNFYIYSFEPQNGAGTTPPPQSSPQSVDSGEIDAVDLPF